MADDKDDKVEPEDEMEHFELPMLFPKRNGPPCPTCDEPTLNVDGDYICLDCNGGMYGPGMA